MAPALCDKNCPQKKVFCGQLLSNSATGCTKRLLVFHFATSGGTTVGIAMNDECDNNDQIEIASFGCKLPAKFIVVTYNIALNSELNRKR